MRTTTPLALLLLLGSLTLRGQTTTSETVCPPGYAGLGEVRCKTVTTRTPAPTGPQTYSGGLGHALAEGLQGYYDGGAPRPARSSASFERVQPIILREAIRGRTYLEALGAPPSVIRGFIYVTTQAMYDAWQKDEQISDDELWRVSSRIAQEYGDWAVTKR